MNETLERFYNVRVATELIPFSSPAALYQFLGKHPEFIPRYVKVGKIAHRLLSESEILKIRQMVLFDREDARFGPPRGRPPGPSWRTEWKKIFEVA